MIWLLFAVLASGCAVGQSAFTKAASIKETIDNPMRFNSWKVGSSFVLFFLFSIAMSVRLCYNDLNFLGESAVPTLLVVENE